MKIHLINCDLQNDHILNYFWAITDQLYFLRLINFNPVFVYSNLLFFLLHSLITDSLDLQWIWTLDMILKRLYVDDQKTFQ